MTRRTITITTLVVLLGVAGWLAWYFLLRTPQQERPALPGLNLPIIGGRAPIGTPPPPAPPSGLQPSEVQIKLRQIVDKDIVAPTIAADKKHLSYIERSSGHLMQSDLDGANETTLVNLTVLETFDGLWSPSKTRVELSYHENGTVKRFVEGTATGTPARFLPADTQSFAWSPDNTRLAYLQTTGRQTNLVLADQNGRGAAVVFSTPVPDFTLVWPAKNTLLLVSRPSGLAPSLLMRFDISSRSANPILGGARGVVVLPLADASGFVFSQSTDQGSAEALNRYSFKDGGVTPLGITTIAEKCVASADSKTLYCGVPAGTIGAPSPDAWYRGAVSFSDDIIALNLISGAITTLTERQADLDVISPFAAPDGSYLFFQNKKDGTLWRLELGR